MAEKLLISEKPKRIYSIEFLRIFFVFFIILGHIMSMYSDVQVNILNFFHTQEMHTWFGVEFFFIIGGFFLYNRVKSMQYPTKIIKNLYIRLAPALIFVFLTCFLFGSKNPGLYIARLPLIATLTAGIGLPGEATGWGDWYVSTYFWCSLLYIGIFYAGYKKAFLWVCVLIYLTVCLKFHAPYKWMGTYFDIICTDLVRGIYSMGLGIITAYLCEKVNIVKKVGTRLFFTVVEFYLLFNVFNYIARSSISQFTFWEIELIFACLMICMVHSLGYITELFNKFSFINFFSKYVYQIFLCHIICFAVLWSHNHYNLPGITCASIIFSGAIILGVFEYHVIEKKLVPWLLNYFSKDVSTK